MNLTSSNQIFSISSKQTKELTSESYQRKKLKLGNDDNNADEVF